ncbi:MAG TPA: tail fiber domain-containing protein [Bacteroidales bacterium]|nr:tail fiber domain-containing protein [Bacteroidales bacterium]HQB21844.1 tail fiber domain-containing protein [Bacteroidales bacterium]
MKTKSILLSAIFAVFTMSAFAQLKVDQYGRIGMGTNYPNPGYKCHIKGNLLLTTYPDNPFIEFRFKVGNGSPGAEIGTTAGGIAFWASEVSYNDLYAASFTKLSDIKLKSNLKVIDFGLERVMKIRPLQYTLIDKKVDEHGNVVEGTKEQFGFVAQEMETLFPEVKLTSDVLNIKLLDYDQIIPVAIAAIQEQQQMIDSLKNEIEAIKLILKLSNFEKSVIVEKIESYEKNSVLFQNTPNPFSEHTTIQYFIQEDGFRTGALLIFDMNGTLIKQMSIHLAGEGEIMIKGYELKAGMYMYSLIVNQKEVDTKKMILLN